VDVPETPKPPKIKAAPKPKKDSKDKDQATSDFLQGLLDLGLD